MLQFEAYTVIGIALGGIFALAALGITVLYRVTGVLNFAQGAMGMFATFVAWQVVFPWGNHRPAWLPEAGWIGVAVVAALIFAAVFGLLLELLVFRHLVGRPAVTKAVITIGILLALQSGATLIWGSSQYHAAIQVVPPSSTSVFGVPVGTNQVIVMIVAVVLSVGLAVFLQLSRFGVAMRAVADDPVAASLWGVPVSMVGAVSWITGSLLAAIAGILITPFINFDTVSLTLVVIDALAAALIGGLVSLPLTVAGGFALGLLETYPSIWIPSLGFPKLVAIVVILVVLIFRTPASLLRSRT